jgi:hypothetical protein
MCFIEYCFENKILLLVLLPHSTHRLQPLDVSLFSPLAWYYDSQLALFNHKNQGWTRFTKRNFFKLFWRAWSQAMSPENIASRWAKTGLYPFNPSIVLKQVEKPKLQVLEPVPTILEDHLQQLLAKENTRENQFIICQVH